MSKNANIVGEFQNKLTKMEIYCPSSGKMSIESYSKAGGVSMSQQKEYNSKRAVCK